MYFEKYGDSQRPTIVFLHGAHVVHSFGKQYCLSDKYYLVVPHIMGYGNDAERVFDTDQAVRELADFIRGLNKTVMLVGFSIGAQLAVRLISEYGELFNSAVFVSPWLIKEEPLLSKVAAANEKQLISMKKKWLCNLMGLTYGLPGAQRKEFVGQVQREQTETIRNTVYNNITLESAEGLANAEIPMIALAGAKEPAEIKESVTALHQINIKCRVEIWEDAKHDIPMKFDTRFNALLCAMMERIGLRK
ncbi:MAG: alpha/beta hydrolase [Butyrivibrio sp.]|nr:alpha/beta hydrolase [Muribaculum sp.]MCM1552193.1 alpha/beta hydrolase [Butyrivibrio sp.]